jgi:c-di-GMP-binding flagellar brake protein YcgR
MAVRRAPSPRPHRAARATPRADAPVEIQIMGQGSLDVLRVRDVSTSGLGVYAAHGFEGFDLAREVDLVVTLPGRRPFLAKGHVRHRTWRDARWFFGVEFTELAERDRAAIDRYVTRRRRERD